MAATTPSSLYYGAYRRFLTVDKRVGAALAGPDNAIGDIGTIELDLDQEKHEVAWLKNPYGKHIGFLDARESRALAVYKAKGWTLRYVLSFTAFSEKPAPGLYWGQAAVFAYAPRHAEQFEDFIKAFAAYAATGSRPDPELSGTAVEAMLANPTAWKPSSSVKIPKEGDSAGRTAILKDHRGTHDKMLDAARSNNKGCLIGGWAFLLAVVALAVYALHSAGIF